MASLAQPVIHADGVMLRPWQPSDRPVLLAAYADPAIQRWHCRSMTDDEARDWIAAWPDRWRTETGAGWAVVEASDIVGQVSLRRVVPQEGLAEVSYWVLPSARGRRIAPRALSAVTAWSFDTLGLHRVELFHSTSNFASCQVALHAGFAAEGTKRGEVRHADGWHDMHIHARLDTDLRPRTASVARRFPSYKGQRHVNGRGRAASWDPSGEHSVAQFDEGPLRPPQLRAALRRALTAGAWGVRLPGLRLVLVDGQRRAQG
jgi:RimJ/RimL family protein N-acetyltransferase